jgi:hypothetical protein
MSFLKITILAMLFVCGPAGSVASQAEPDLLRGEFNLYLRKVITANPFNRSGGKEAASRKPG